MKIQILSNKRPKNINPLSLQLTMGEGLGRYRFESEAKYCGESAPRLINLMKVYK